jgi:hypothetical protein
VIGKYWGNLPRKVKWVENASNMKPRSEEKLDEYVGAAA